MPFLYLEEGSLIARLQLMVENGSYITQTGIVELEKAHAAKDVEFERLQELLTKYKDEVQNLQGQLYCFVPCVWEWD